MRKNTEKETTYEQFDVESEEVARKNRILFDTLND